MLILTATKHHVRLEVAGPLNLPQAVGPPFVLLNPTLVLSWGPAHRTGDSLDGARIRVEVLGTYNKCIGMMVSVDARNRTVDELERDNPGLAALLRAAAPGAPWSAAAS